MRLVNLFSASASSFARNRFCVCAACALWMLTGGALLGLSADDAAKLTRLGLPNFYRVSENLYRCAQPTVDGLAGAEKLGIKTVINLRAFHSDTLPTISPKLRVEHIHFKTWHAEEEDMVRFLKLVSNTNNGPFLVHCQHGADRTGTMVAIYRMAVQGWSKEAALKEMTTGGFGYHTMWTNLISYLNAVDVAKLQREAGLVTSP